MNVILKMNCNNKSKLLGYILVLATIHILPSFANDAEKLEGLLDELVHKKPECEMFMGPSLLKEAVEQGYGMGMFTGKMLFEGQVLESMEEVLLPIYDSAILDEDHPPLREYLWPGSMLPEISLVGRYVEIGVCISYVNIIFSVDIILVIILYECSLSNLSL